MLDYRMQPEATDPVLCPRYHAAVELIGRRWNGAILALLKGGPARFSDLGTAIPDISDRMLTERLRELGAAGLLDRKVTPCTPVKIEYALTEKGRALQPILGDLARWAHDW